VAQLGARFHGMEEVIGSIPIRSTNQSSAEPRSENFSPTLSALRPMSMIVRLGFFSGETSSLAMAPSGFVSLPFLSLRRKPSPEVIVTWPHIRIKVSRTRSSPNAPRVGADIQAILEELQQQLATTQRLGS
jgi:hypothetical protein